MVVAVAAIGIIIAWWLIWNDPSVDAQEVLEDACDFSEAIYDFDIILQDFNPEADYPRVFDTRISNDNIHMIVSSEYSDRKSEYIDLKSVYHDESIASGASGSKEDSKFRISEFSRHADDSGQWGEWEVTISVTRSYSSAQEESTAQADSSQASSTFCRWAIEEFDSFEFAGEGTVEGTKTSHYIGTYYPNGPDDEKVKTFELWVDEAGRLLQEKWDTFTPGWGHSITIFTMSNFGEPNIIVAPVTGTLHEALIDVGASSGGAVGFTSAAGELVSAGFTVEGTGATEIKELIWQDGTVSLTLSPQNTLTGYVLDFFAVDGTVSLSLDAATATADSGKLTWSVASQPWQDGDHLMLRIRETGSTPILPP